MHKNMGDTDRKVRGVAAALLLLVAWAVGFGTIGGVIAVVLATVMVGTAAVGFCPLYAPFHINTGHRASRAH
jgi:hypothetical protein